MKKTALVLALGAAFSGAVMAQSSVTLYGRAQLAYDRDFAAQGQNSISMKDYNSRFGLRGSEDLGGGMAAVFGLEMAYTTDTGTLTAGAAGRNAYVGLSDKKLGTLIGGRLDGGTAGSPLHSQWGAVWSNVANNTGNSGYTNNLSGTSVGAIGGTSGGTFLTDERVSNALAYRSPSFGGVTVAARVAFAGTDQTSGAGALSNNAAGNTANGAGREQDSKRYQLAATYSAKGLVAGLGFQTNTYGHSTVTANNAGAVEGNNNLLNNRWQAAVGYDAKVVKVGVFYARNSFVNAYGDGVNPANTNNSKTNSNEFGVSVRVPFGKHSVVANYGQRGQTTGASNVAIAAPNSNAPAGSYNIGLGTVKQTQLGYGYSLSARTNLHVYYQLFDTNTKDIGSHVGTNAGDNQRLISVGMSHAF